MFSAIIFGAIIFGGTFQVELRIYAIYHIWSRILALNNIGRRLLLLKVCLIVLKTVSLEETETNFKPNTKIFKMVGLDHLGENGSFENFGVNRSQSLSLQSLPFSIFLTNVMKT